MSKESKAGYESLKEIIKRARKKEIEVLEVEIRGVVKYLKERYKALQEILPEHVIGKTLYDYKFDHERILTLERAGVKVVNRDKERNIVGTPSFISVDQYFEECLNKIDNMKDKYWFLKLAYTKLLELESSLM